jgi:hypothetical protein
MYLDARLFKPGVVSPAKRTACHVRALVISMHAASTWGSSFREPLTLQKRAAQRRESRTGAECAEPTLGATRAPLTHSTAYEERRCTRHTSLQHVCLDQFFPRFRSPRPLMQSAAVVLHHVCSSKVHQVELHPTLPWVAAADRNDHVVVLDRITGRRVLELSSLEAARVQVASARPSEYPFQPSVAEPRLHPFGRPNPLTWGGGTALSTRANGEQCNL